MAEVSPYARKSCGPCIALKAKCTHTRPCERCVRRGVECVDVVRKPRQKKPKVPVNALQILSQLLPAIDPLDILKLQNIQSNFTPPLPLPDSLLHPSSPPSPSLSPPLSPPSAAVPSPPLPPESLHVESEFFGNSDIFQEFGICQTTGSLPQPDNLQTFYVTPPDSTSPLSSPHADDSQKFTSTSSSTSSPTFPFVSPADSLQTCTTSTSTSSSSSFLPSPSLPQTNDLTISSLFPSPPPPTDNLQLCTTSSSSSSFFNSLLPPSMRAEFTPTTPQIDVQISQLANPTGILSNALVNLVRKLASGNAQDAHAQVVSELQNVKYSIEQFLAYAESSRPREINVNPALYIMDPQNLIVRDCNENFLRILGCEKESIQGYHVGKLCVPFFWRVVKRDIDWFRARNIVRGERYIGLKHANGGMVYSMGHFQLLSQNYSVMTLGAIFEDVPRCLQIAYHHYLGLTSSNRRLESSPDCQLPYCHCKMIHLPMPPIDPIVESKDE